MVLSEADTIKNHAKFKPMNSGFCNYIFCMRNVRLTDENKCCRCGSPVAKKEITHKATIDKFEKILEQNRYALENHIFSDVELNGIKIPVQIGIGNKEYFFVPLRYFVEFQNFKHSEDYKDDKKSIGSFIEHIKSVSPRVTL